MGGFHDTAMEAARRDAAPREPGRVWLVMGDKRGDNAQIDILVESLGWHCERKELAMRPPFDKAKPRYRASLAHLDLARSDRLEPPWPDLILTVGRRPSMAALWVAEQSAGRTRIVLLGKPSGLLQRFDLVILSSEVQIPAYPNVLKIGLPLMRVRRREVELAAEAWRTRLADLPRPLVGVLVGGPTHPFVYDRSVVARLVALARDIVREGGTPYFTTSRRTPPAVVEALRAELPRETRLFAWTADASDNPYTALLGLADEFVVTGDSLSMIVEVVRLGKPLALFPLPVGWWGALDQRRRSLARWLFAAPTGGAGETLRAALGRTVHRCGLLSHTRDFTAIHDFLLERGLASVVGAGFPTSSAGVPDDLPAAVARVRALVASSPPRGG